MVSISGIACVVEPLLPLIVAPNVPAFAPREALIVSVESPPAVVAVTGFVLKLALVALGRPVTLRFTELELFTAVTVTVVGLLDPRVTVSELGDAERLKSAVELALIVNEPMAVLHR